MHWIFGVTIQFEDADYVVNVRDLPEVVTSGISLDEALALAADAIEVAVAGRIDDEMPLARPTQFQLGEYRVALAPQIAAKASLYILWREAGLSKSELGRRLGRTETEARRILSARHGTKLNHMQEAARAMGASLVVGFAKA